jgi:hypothetical protein
MNSQDSRQQGNGNFAASAAAKRTNVVREFLGFLRQNRKWWLLPLITCLAIVAILIILGSTAAAPFIYTLW